MAPTMGVGKHFVNTSRPKRSFELMLALWKSRLRFSSALIISSQPLQNWIETVFGQDEGKYPDPDVVKGMLKNTLVLLGNYYPPRLSHPNRQMPVP